MTDYKMFIPFVNREDLLHKAIASASDLREELAVIDNSPDGLKNPLSGITVIRPSVPLNSPQTFNFMMTITRDMGADICIWMHNDAEAHPGVCAELLNRARLYTAQRRKWGFLFTNYDALSAMSVEMFREVGPWDTTFHQYFCDNDQQRRARLAGFECICTDLPVNHIGSQTIHSDASLMDHNRATFLLYRDYYARRWGGEPGKETYTVPFGREL